MIRNSIRKLIGHNKGSTTIIFSLAAVTLCGALGGALDYARYVAARRVTQSAIDAAVLAGARTLLLDAGNTAAAITTATNYYNRNVAGRSPLMSDTIVFVVADSNTAITATGQAFLKTTFMNVLGIPSIRIASAAGAGFPKAKISGGGGSNIEVAVMLDVTGSMCSSGNSSCSSGTKVTGMKDAAKELIDIVVRDDQSVHYSKVALIPFATRVRVGPNGGGGTVMEQLTNLPPTWTGWYKTCTSESGANGNEDDGNWSCSAHAAEHKDNWAIMPCATDRYYNSTSSYDYTDTVPSSGAWLNAHGGDRMPASWDSSDNAPGSEVGLTNADPATHWNYNELGECADTDENNEVMPLSSNRIALKSKVDSLVAHGSTAGALGTAFSWYMLSPNWSSIWTGSSAPGSYADLTTTQASGAKVLRKVAVLMTDGVFNTFRGWKGQDQQDMSNHAKQLCTNMKAAGIEIYTVGFALDELSIAQRAIAIDTLSSCGTDVNHFYQTLTPAELSAAFQDIGIKLSTISLSR